MSPLACKPTRINRFQGDCVRRVTGDRGTVLLSPLCRCDKGRVRHAHSNSGQCSFACGGRSYFLPMDLNDRQDLGAGATPLSATLGAFRAPFAMRCWLEVVAYMHSLLVHSRHNSTTTGGTFNIIQEQYDIVPNPQSDARGTRVTKEPSPCHLVLPIGDRQVTECV